MYQDILNGDKKVAVIGLGYVGLPIALAFARKVSVIGFDINAARVDLMRKGIDPSNELDSSEFEGCDIHFTADGADLKDANFFIVAVPTPVDSHNVPDLKPLLAASRTVGAALSKGDYVVYESTVYPGCTEEDCLPVLEEVSGLKLGTDFKLGYSPERINPGDKEHTLSRIIKVVSGSDAEALEVISKVYKIVVDAGIHAAPAIKVAEAAKIIENTQRDVNIALMNELSKIFNRLDINTYDVLEAAGTKWNFLNFYPGLVGGHCIGVDPYYLTYKSIEMGYEPEVILSGRRINDDMPFYIGRKVVQHIVANGNDIKGSKVLVMGATFKENVSDIRNSKVADLIAELKKYSVNVEVTDPHADSEELMEEYGFGLVENVSGPYDAVVLAVGHDEYADCDEAYFKRLMKDSGLLVDVKGMLRNKVDKAMYWSL